jgi:hypothetical protein
MPAARDLSIRELRILSRLQVNAPSPKKCDPEIGRLRRDCDASLGRNPRSTVGFAQDQLLPVASRGPVPVPAITGSGTQASNPLPLAPKSPRRATRMRTASATVEAVRNAAGLERPIKTPAVPSSSPHGVSGPFWRGALCPACGGLTSPSSGAPRTQSFAHQLLDHFAASRLRLRLRRDERVHPS